MLSCPTVYHARRARVDAPRARVLETALPFEGASGSLQTPLKTMNDKDDQTDAATRADAHDAGGATHASGAGRELLLLEAWGRLFALSAEEVEATAEDLRPTPLPFAPPSVLGVVCLRGRVRTVLDARILLARACEAKGADDDTKAASDGTKEAGDSPRFFVALRGDEQLALAARRVARIEVSPGEIQTRDEPGVVCATFVKDGEQVPLLEPSRLFETALQGAERRRKR